MYQYKIGQVIPEFLNHDEMLQFDLADDGAFMLVFFKNPTEDEIEQFQSNQPFEIRLTKMKNIIFLMSKIGNLEWMDAPYNPHLSQNLTKYTLPSEGYGLGLMLILIDAVTGCVKSLRLLELSEKFTKSLYQEVINESVKDFDYKEYLKSINEIYMEYQTKDLKKLSNSYCKIG